MNIKDIAYTATSAYMMGYINFHIHPDKGSHLIYHLLESGQAEYMRVEVSEKAVHFWMHKTGKNDNNVVTLTFEFVNKVNPNADGLYNVLHTEKERSQLLDAIRDYINSVECPGVYMASNRIYLEKPAYVKPQVQGASAAPEPIKPAEPVKKKEPVKNPASEKPEHPDMYESMTSHGIWLALYESFGPGSSFEKLVKEAPATCFVTAEREALRVTMMFENAEHAEMAGNGGTNILEYNYKQCTQKKFMALLSEGQTVTSGDMLHNFDVLEHEEDRAELVDYLMYFIDTIPHVIVEGNSFRSRRSGEEIIEIDHSLTAKVMSQKIVQLFGLDGEVMDILRRSNIAYCLICSFADYIKLIYVDTDDETIHTVRYDFADLVSADFMEGEGCFSRLTCNYEKDSLDEYLGRAVCSLPYFTPCMTAEGEMYCQVYLNKAIVPGLDEPFIPASDPEPNPAKSGEPAEAKHPDMYESLTARGLAKEIEESFGENTPFAYMAQQIAVTCYVTVSETGVGITMMVEDEEKAKAMGGFTNSFALLYSQAGIKGMQAKLEAGAVLTPESFLNDFECLEFEEDREALLNYLMKTIEAFPHVAVEGNSFRSRKENEALVDVEHSLTSKVMSNKIAKLFSMDSKAVDILRRNNVFFCQIAAYRDFVKLIYADADYEVLGSDCYEFSDLVDADFLTGEACFDHLESENEQIRLSRYLGEKVCQLMYMMPMADNSQIYYDMVLLNKDMVPGLDEPFSSKESEEPEIPVVTVNPADFEEPEEPLYMDDPIHFGGGMPLPPDEPEAPIYTMQSSPTTWSMVQYLNMQFGPGGGLARFAKDSGFNGAEVKAGESELMIRFWKYQNNTPERVVLTAMMMQYAQFNKGMDGEYEGFLSDEEKDELETILKNTVPYFK